MSHSVSPNLACRFQTTSIHQAPARVQNCLKRIFLQRHQQHRVALFQHFVGIRFCHHIMLLSVTSFTRTLRRAAPPVLRPAPLCRCVRLGFPAKRRWFRLGMILYSPPAVSAPAAAKEPHGDCRQPSVQIAAEHGGKGRLKQVARQSVHGRNTTISILTGTRPTMASSET